MSKLIESFYEFYVKRLNKVSPVGRAMMFLVYIISFFYIGKPSEKDGFIHFISSISIRNLIDSESGLIVDLTLGQVFVSVFWTLLTIYLYGLIKKIFFHHLSKRRGFEPTIKKWVKRTQEQVSQSSSVSSDFVKDLRERIGVRARKIITMHSFGECILSVVIVIALSLNTFSWLDFIIALFAFLLIVLLQRHLYVYYLSEVLPDMVTEAVFMGEGYTHKRLFEEIHKFSEVENN